MEDLLNNKNDNNRSESRVELAFPKYEQEEDDEYISKGGSGEIIKHLSTSMDSIADWLNSIKWNLSNCGLVV